MSQHERRQQSVPTLEIPTGREFDGDESPGSPSPPVATELHEMIQLQIGWETAMKDMGDKGLPQKHCAVLLLSWVKELDDLNTTGEVDALGAVFQTRFHYTVRKQQILSGKSPEVQLQYFLASFVHEFDSPSTLLIVYYAGHGIPGKPGELKLAGKRKPSVNDEYIKRGDILWHQAENLLKIAVSNVLVIFDCCFAGNIAVKVDTRGNYKRNFEFLGACQANSMTPRPGPESFTTALIWSLEKLARLDRSFTTLELMTLIRENAPKFPQYQVPYLCERDEHCINRLVLAPLRDDMECAKSNAEEPGTVYECLDFRFFFKEKPDLDEIKRLAEQLKYRIRTRQITAHNVGWLGSPTFAKLRHAATVWRTLAIGKNSKRVSRRSSPNLTLPTSQDIQIETPSPSPPRKDSQKVEDLLQANGALNFSTEGFSAQIDGHKIAKIDIEGTITPSRGIKRPRPS